jgi:hypothetical protein
MLFFLCSLSLLVLIFSSKSSYLNHQKCLLMYHILKAFQKLLEGLIT